MARQITHRSTSEFPAERMYSVMVDVDYLKARLDRLGGPGAALLEHEADAHGARYRLKHGVDPGAVPSMVRGLVPNNLVIERTETLTADAPGRYSGTVAVSIPGTPASASGVMRLVAAGAGSEFVVDAAVTVKVPLIGSRIEDMVAEQIGGLLRSESEFTVDYLRQR